MVVGDSGTDYFEEMVARVGEEWALQEKVRQIIVREGAHGTLGW